MEYYSAIKNEEILPYAIVWIDLEGIMLSKICQTKTNTECSQLYRKYKQKQKQIQQTQRKRDQICGYEYGKGKTGGNWSEV